MVEVVLDEVRVVAAGVFGVLVMGVIACVNLLEVMAVGRLILGLKVSGKPGEEGILGVFTEMVLSQVSTVGIWVLVKIVFMIVVLMPVELRPSVMKLVGSVSVVIKVEVSIYVGRIVPIPELEALTISVVKGKTEKGMVGVDVTSVLGSISTHGIVGEVGTIVMVIVSGQSVVEGREI